MSDALVNALAQLEGKLKRQEENHAATAEIMEILGESPKERRKYERQKDDIAQTKSDIKKIQAALNKK